MLKIALAHAKAGIAVFPAKVFWNGTKWRKRPLVRWRDDASTDPLQILGWWQWCPWAVPGLDLDRANLVVIDADRHGGPDGIAAFAALGELPPHPVLRTAGGGEHHVFRQPAMRLGNRTGGLPPGIDVRGAGGWIVAPGSVRPDGARWTGDLIGALSAVPVLPERIVELIGEGKPPADEGTPRVTSLTVPTWREAISDRRVTVLRWSREESFALAALDNAVQRVASAESDKEKTLNGETYAIGRLVGWISLARAAQGMLIAARRAGFPDNDDVRGKIVRALHDGMERPYPPLRPVKEVTRRVCQQGEMKWT